MAQAARGHDSEKPLRHPKVVSSLDELAGGEFHRSCRTLRPQPMRSSACCCAAEKFITTGREHREETKRDDVAIIRIEQLLSAAHEILEHTLAVCIAKRPRYSGYRRNQPTWERGILCECSLVNGCSRLLLAASPDRFLRTPATGFAQAASRSRLKLFNGHLRNGSFMVMIIPIFIRHWNSPHKQGILFRTFRPFRPRAKWGEIGS